MSDTKICPFCAEEIQTAAIKCKHCGSILTDSAPQGVVTPQASSPATEARPLPPPPQDVQQAQQPVTEPEPKYTYSIVLENIENKEVKYDFAKRLNHYLKIPFPQMSKILVPGQVLKSDMEKAETENLLELLSIPGIKLSITQQTAPTEGIGCGGCLYGTVAILMFLGLLIKCCEIIVGSEHIYSLEFIVGMGLLFSSLWTWNENYEKFGMGLNKASWWGLGVLLLWPIFFPYYLIKRSEFIRDRQS